MSRGWLLALGWLSLVAYAIYWPWELGRPENEEISSWHAWFNTVLYFGAPVLFVALLILSLVWLNGRKRAER